MDDMSMNTELEGTTPIEPEKNEGTITENDTETAPQDRGASDDTAVTEQQDNGAAAEGTSVAAEEPFLSIQYNHEIKGLSREEAASLAQKGIYYQGVYDKLDYVATQMDTDVDTLVENLLKKQEDGYRQSLVDKLGEDSDLIDGLMQVYRNNQKEKYDKAVADRKTKTETAMTSRLADEFVELRAEFPELEEFKDLPDTVKKKAAEGMNLTAAFLLYKHNENKRIAAAQDSAIAAEKASAGSASSAGDVSDPVVDAFMSGLLRR